MPYEQKELVNVLRKKVCLNIDADVLRLAKAMAARKEISLQSAVETMLRQWINGNRDRGKDE